MKYSKLSLFLVGAVVALFLSVEVSAQDKTAKPVKLTGQLVCSLCWFEADRKTTPYGNAADIQCAKECSEKGIPTGLAVKEGEDYKLYIVEPGRVKKSPAEWLDSVGKRAEVSGRIKRTGDKDYIQIDELKILPDELQTASQSKVLGTEVDLALKDLFGAEQKLSSYRGKLVVLNFWATWCTPCRKEMPDLAAIQNEYAAYGVQTVGAAADELDGQAKVVQFIKEAGVNFPIWLGATTLDMARFGVGPALPATVIVGRDGKIVFLKPGPITRKELKKELDRIMTPGLHAMAAANPPAHKTDDSSLVPS